ncbi:hypothetical protein [Microbulbifer magnicolonia]|uniref:hypothetical protein n=1 Tax=Microbulbifer magnicolonia TaxID=3109744 RepID=UPI002B40D95A|nr:hypothetical protein [Microbulbifer sp. GG15]
MKTVRKTALALLSILAFPPAFAGESEEPLGTMSTCLIMHNWTSWGMWQFDVYALAGDKILIGSKDNHFLVSATEPGYRHIIAGEVVGTYPEATTLADLGRACQEGCPVNHKKRTGWFRRRCDAYAP